MLSSTHSEAKTAAEQPPTEIQPLSSSLIINTLSYLDSRELAQVKSATKFLRAHAKEVEPLTLLEKKEAGNTTLAEVLYRIQRYQKILLHLYNKNKMEQYQTVKKQAEKEITFIISTNYLSSPDNLKITSTELKMSDKHLHDDPARGAQHSLVSLERILLDLKTTNEALRQRVKQTTSDISEQDADDYTICPSIPEDNIDNLTEDYFKIHFPTKGTFHWDYFCLYNVSFAGPFNGDQSLKNLTFYRTKITNFELPLKAQGSYAIGETLSKAIYTCAPIAFRSKNNNFTSYLIGNLGTIINKMQDQKEADDKEITSLKRQIEELKKGLSLTAAMAQQSQQPATEDAELTERHAKRQRVE